MDASIQHVNFIFLVLICQDTEKVARKKKASLSLLDNTNSFIVTIGLHLTKMNQVNVNYSIYYLSKFQMDST